MKHTYDVLVIGGGPAGVSAALRARELGAQVALIERGAMGGTCTNDGCVPTRVLAKAARLVRDAEQFGDYGLTGSAPTVDFAALLRRTNAIIAQLHEKKDLADHLEHAGVDLFADAGAARFADAHHVALEDGTTLQAAQIIICAGGHARRLDFPGSQHALTHSDVWSLTQLPRTLAIVGSAATGCQLASVFAAFGTRVTLLELAPRILPGEDATVSEAMHAAFTRRDVAIIIGIGGVARIEPGDDGFTLVYTHDEQEQHLSVDQVIMAVGWPGNLDALNLGAAQVRRERNYITVDDTLRTSMPHIFAAGDITGRMMLVQSAVYEARTAAENAVRNLERAERHAIVPHGGFTDPEYASVGITEAQARRQHDCVVATVPYADLDRAVIDGRTEGFCKLIVARETHTILGAHVVGEQAVEIVQIIATGIAAGMSIERLAQLELAYPTFAAVVGLAARQIARELGALAVSSGWGTFAPPRAAEWERGS